MLNTKEKIVHLYNQPENDILKDINEEGISTSDIKNQFILDRLHKHYSQLHPLFDRFFKERMLKKISKDDEKIIEKFLFDMHPYLKCVEKGLLEYDTHFEDIIEKLLLRKDVGNNIKKLAIDILKLCCNINNSEIHGRNYRIYETRLPDFSFIRELDGYVHSIADKRIVVVINVEENQQVIKEFSYDDKDAVIQRFEPGTRIVIRLEGETRLINKDEKMELKEKGVIIDNKSTQAESSMEIWRELLTIQEENQTDDGSMKNIAYDKYLEEENKLLKKHPGKYIWIEGTEIKEISPDLIDLLKKAEDAEKQGSDPNNTIVRKIEKDTGIYIS